MNFTENPATVIKILNLYKSYNTEEALKGIDLEIFKGEIFVLLGPNGAGKTTTAKIISGILKPDKGTVTIFSIPVTPENVEVKKYIGFLPDDPHIYPKLTGKEFIEFILSIYSKKLNLEKYKFYLDQFELEPVIDKLIETYSKGYRQKLLLTTVFLREPEIYILDEPMVGLDPKSISFFTQHLIHTAQQNKTILLCTHLLHLAEKVATRIGIIHKGKILISGTKSELVKKLNLDENVTMEEIYLNVLQNYYEK